MKYAICLMLGLVAAAGFQEPAVGSIWEGIDGRLNAGAAVPATPKGFTSDWNPMLTAGAGVGFIVTDVVTVALDFSYSYFPHKHRGLRENALQNIFLSAGARFYPKSPPAATFRAYLGGGVGYFLSWDQYSAEHTVGVDGNLGVEVSAGTKRHAFFELVYVVGFPADDVMSFVLGRVGLAIDLS